MFSPEANIDFHLDRDNVYEILEFENSIRGNATYLEQIQGVLLQSNMQLVHSNILRQQVGFSEVVCLMRDEPVFLITPGLRCHVLNGSPVLNIPRFEFTPQIGPPIMDLEDKETLEKVRSVQRIYKAACEIGKQLLWTYSYISWFCNTMMFSATKKVLPPLHSNYYEFGRRRPDLQACLPTQDRMIGLPTDDDDDNNNNNNNNHVQKSIKTGNIVSLHSSSSDNDKTGDWELWSWPQADDPDVYMSDDSNTYMNVYNNDNKDDNGNSGYEAGIALKVLKGDRTQYADANINLNLVYAIIGLAAAILIAIFIKFRKIMFPLCGSSIAVFGIILKQVFVMISTIASGAMAGLNNGQPISRT